MNKFELPKLDAGDLGSWLSFGEARAASQKTRFIHPLPIPSQSAAKRPVVGRTSAQIMSDERLVICHMIARSLSGEPSEAAKNPKKQTGNQTRC